MPAGIRTGMFGHASFAIGKREALLVPQSAILERGQQHLLDHQPRLVVVQRRRVIQSADSEIPFAELALREKRREHKDRIVAALKALRKLRVRQITRTGLLNASFRFPSPASAAATSGF
jgi:hypothetical protein